LNQEAVPIEQHIAGIAALNEPARRALYLHIVTQGGDVRRDQAAQALGMPRSVAAFHLDKLVDEVRRTLLHEIGHHFGIDEDDLPF